MSVIWKYRIEPDTNISMPVGAQILTVQLQYGEPHIWVMVDPAMPKESRYFVTIPTGKEFNAMGLEYIGTFTTSF